MFVTIGMTDAKSMGKLAGLPAQGQIDKLLLAEVDLVNLNKMLAAMPADKLPAPVKEMIASVLTGGKITISAAGDGTGLVMELNAPFGVLMKVAKMGLMGQQAPPQAQPAPGGL